MVTLRMKEIVIPPRFKFCLRTRSTISYNKLYEHEDEYISDECYFCRESDVVDEHHVLPKSIASNDSYHNLLPLCPNHHATLHRSVASLVKVDGLFFLWYDMNRITFPSSVNINVRRKGLRNNVMVKYSINGDIKFKIEKLNLCIKEIILHDLVKVRERYYNEVTKK